MTPLPSADEILTSLESKQAQVAELQKKLRGSLALKDFMPDAFEHGSCKVGGSSNEYRPHEGTVTFTLGNGVVRTMKAMKVPYGLWPVGMRLAFESLPRRDQERLRKKMVS